MSDPLSIIASVAAVSTAALQSAQILLQLIDGIKNAPEEIAAVSNDTHAFYDVVLSLETSLKDDDIVTVVREDTAMVAMVANIEKPLRNCSTTLGQIMFKIQGRVRSAYDGKGSRFSSGAQWYFRKKDIKESLNRLGQNKATLNAALNTISAFCHLRLMATTSREPDDWSSMVNDYGSMCTDVGFALNRFVHGTVTLAFASPPPLASDSDTRSRFRIEDSAQELDSKTPRTALPNQETCTAISQRAALENSSELLNASMLGNNLTAQKVLLQGANVNAKFPDSGWTALHLATAAKADDVVQTLLTQGAKVNAVTVSYDPCTHKAGGLTALHIASCNRDKRTMQLLLNNDADVLVRSATEVSPLERAIMQGSTDVVRILIQNGPLKRTADNTGETPLHKAANLNGDSPAERASERLEITRLLLNRGADVEARTRFTRKTPLHVAVKAGHVGMAQLLLDRGADLTARASFGLTVLHYAAAYGRVQMVQWLLDAGTDIEVKDHKGVTALHVAAHEGKTEIIELLLKRGADVTACSNLGHNALYNVRQHSQNTAEKILERYMLNAAWKFQSSQV